MRFALCIFTLLTVVFIQVINPKTKIYSNLAALRCGGQIVFFLNFFLPGDLTSKSVIFNFLKQNKLSSKNGS